MADVRTGIGPLVRVQIANQSVDGTDFRNATMFADVEFKTKSWVDCGLPMNTKAVKRLSTALRMAPQFASKLCPT